MINSLGTLPMQTTGIQPKCVSSAGGQTRSLDLVVKNQRKFGDRHETRIDLMSSITSMNSYCSLRTRDFRLPAPGTGNNNMADATKWKMKATAVTFTDPEVMHGQRAS